MRLRKDGLQAGAIIANSDYERLGGRRTKRPVKIAAPVTEAISINRPANEWRQRNRWHYNRHIGRRNGNVPVATHHAGFGCPAAKDEWRSFCFDDRQSDYDTAVVEFLHQGT